MNKNFMGICMLVMLLIGSGLDALSTYGLFLKVFVEPKLSLQEAEMVLRILYPCLQVSNAVRQKIKASFRTKFCKGKTACKEIDDVSGIPFTLLSKLEAKKQDIIQNLSKEMGSLGSSLALLESQLEQINHEIKHLKNALKTLNDIVEQKKLRLDNLKDEEAHQQQLLAQKIAGAEAQAISDKALAARIAKAQDELNDARKESKRLQDQYINALHEKTMLRGQMAAFIEADKDFVVAYQAYEMSAQSMDDAERQPFVEAVYSSWGKYQKAAGALLVPLNEFYDIAQRGIRAIELAEIAIELAQENKGQTLEQPKLPTVIPQEEKKPALPLITPDQFQGEKKPETAGFPR